MEIVLLALAIWAVLEVAFFLLHQRPLSDSEIKRLSAKRKKKYIRKHYSFSITDTQIDSAFKSSMNPRGKLYKTNLPLDSFPAYVALLLKGKQHEWVLIALEGNSTVKYFWANKGDDKNSVAFNCNLDELISLCEESGSHTLMRFHNHPNSNPNYQTCFLASKQDKRSAADISDIVNEQGLNWIDFVCERGRYLKFYESFSERFVPSVAAVETIKILNGKSNIENYKLHRELGLIFRW